MKKTIKTSIIVIFLSVIGLYSCKKEYFEFDKMRKEKWQNVNMQLPVVNTSLVLRDILKDYDNEELFVVDDEGFLSLIYNQTAFTKYAKDLIILNDLDLPTDNLAGNTISGTNITITNNQNFQSFTGAQLNNIIYDSLTISISVTNSMTTTGTLIVQFPGLTKNGSMAQIFITNFSGTTTQLYTGYTLDLATNGPNNIQYNYIFDGCSGSVAQSTNLTVSLKNQDYKLINGFVGNQALDLPLDSVNAKIFDKKFEGQLYFQNPKIQFLMENSFGAPIKIQLDNISSKDYDNVYSPIYALNLLKNPVNYPTIVGQLAKDSMLFDTISAPWIRDFITYKPRYIFFDALAEINPDGAIGNNFILDTSNFKLNMRFILPLWGRAEYPTLIDTTKLDMAKDYKKLDEITYLKFRLDINNGMATEIRVQAYFIDTNGVAQDSLFLNRSQWIVVDGGITNGDGRVVQKTRKITEIIYDRAKINKLEHVSDVVYVVEVRTDGIEQHKLVKFYASDAVDIKMGIHVKGATDFDFTIYEDDTTSTN